MQRPECYWNDIERYCDGIFTGLPITASGRPPVICQRMQYNWPSREEGVGASLRKQAYRILGSFVITYHHLGLHRIECDTELSHFIRFNPDRHIIERVQDDDYPTTRENTLTEYVRTLWARSRMAAQFAILTPTEADYALLHEELQRGAQFRAHGLGSE